MTETPAPPERSEAQKARLPGSGSPRMQERLERELRAKRTLFVASVAGLAAALGIVAVSAGVSPTPGLAQPAQTPESPGQRVVAEIPIQPVDGRGVETIVRIVAPAQNAPAPDIRTRAS